MIEGQLKVKHKSVREALVARRLAIRRNLNQHEWQLVVVLVGMAILLPATAFAGVIVDIEHRQDGEPTTNGRLFLDKGVLKMVADTETRGEPELIYRGSEERMLIVDHERKSFMSIDLVTMQQLADRMAEMQAKMEQALSQLPPEQRQAAEQMMKQQLPAGVSDADGTPVDLKVVALEGKQEKQGKSCKGYDVKINGELQSRIWATDWKNVGIGPQDFSAFVEMAEFFQKLMQSMPAMASENTTELFSGLNEIDGFPVLVEGFTNGVADSQTVFGEPQVEKLDAATFKPPAGYKEQSMDG